MPELRIDPICGRRVYVAEDRAGRPNDYAASESGQSEEPTRRGPCPFCAGNESQTPGAVATVLDAAGCWRVRVVPNKFPIVLLSDGSAPGGMDAGRPQDPVGVHEVIIESPDHVRQLTDLAPEQLTLVLGVYRDRLQRWSNDGRLRHGMVFKNSGFAGGASLEHVHSQLIALPYVPPAMQSELDGAEQFFSTHGRCAFCDLLQREIASRERVFFNGSTYAAICAFAGRQPFETWIVPERHASRFDVLSDADLTDMALVLHEIVRRLSSVFDRQGRRLAYNLVLHSGPFSVGHADDFHWHWELTPRTTPLAGFEWGAGVYVNPVSPERAARELRAS